MENRGKTLENQRKQWGNWWKLLEKRWKSKEPNPEPKKKTLPKKKQNCQQDFAPVCKFVEAGQRGLWRTWSSANFIGWFCVGLGAEVSAYRKLASFPQIFSLRGFSAHLVRWNAFFVFADWCKWFSCQKMCDSGAWIGDLNPGWKRMPCIDSSHMSWAGEHLLSCKLWRPLQQIKSVSTV